MPRSFRRPIGIVRYRLIAILAIVVAPTTAHAVLIAEERYLTSAAPAGPEYALGAIEGQNPTSFGFAGAWFSSNGTSPTVAAASLNYVDANFPAETGGRMLSPTGNSRIHRLLAPATNPFQATSSGTAYLSFLLQTGTNSGYRAFEMHNGGNDDGANRTLQVGLSSFTDFPSTSQFGFRVNNNSDFDASLGAEDLGVHLFLVKFALSTTNNADAITVWNNPNIASLASDPAGGVTLSGFNFLADRLGAGHFNGNQYGLDELRLGTTLTDVLTNFLRCDVNGNGVCNSSDVAIISEHMYLTGAFADGDVDGSGTIDFADVRLFKDHPARVVGFDAPGGGGAIPEPASLVVLGVAALCCCRFRTRRSRFPSALSASVAMLLLGTILVGGQQALAADEDLLNDNIGFSGKTLNLRPWAALPAGFNDMISMTLRPDDTRQYVTTQEGTVFVINESADSMTAPAPWFNAASALQTATGRTMNGTDGQRGLQSVAFHPDFGDSATPGYGKLYTTMLENRPTNPSDPAHFYLGNSTYGGGGGDGVLAEWTYNHATGQVDANSYRELFRTNMQNFDHPIKQAKFNPYAEPGDEDYGLLYMTHGDSNNQDSLGDDPQDRGDLMGKMIRINPLQSGDDRYTIPDTNPFYSGSNPSPAGTAVLGEVYAYGFRNPHTYSFNLDEDGNTRIFAGDIGRSNMEEINLVAPGGNFGWTKREGTFIHLQGSTYPPNPSPNAGYIHGVTPLAANEATIGVGPDGNRYVYPVGQYDHNGASVTLGQDFTATSVASGFVIHNGSDPTLDNQLVFFNFAFNHGDVYHADFDAMLGAVTQLDPNDPARNEPSELTQAQLQRFHLALDHDNNPNTPAQTSDSLNSLLGVFRNDSRVGEGVSGEMYLTDKSTDNGNFIYLVTNTVPINRLTLTVDRGTGSTTITNSSGQDIVVDRVSVFSPSGSLVPTEFESLDTDWAVTGANTTRALNQSNTTGSLNVTGATAVSLGDVYEGQLVDFGAPVGDDVQFVYWTEGLRGRSFAGDVVYTGVSTVPNTIVLTIDVVTGKAAMLNQTPFTQEVEGYTISSADGSLDTSGWDSLDAQGIEGGDWIASPALATRLTELQEDGTTTFDDLTSFDLGEILQSGAAQDLVFEFLLAGKGTLLEGMVQYILAGDYNGDDVVDAADYTVWRDHLQGAKPLPNDMSPESVTLDDYLVWKDNFGEVMPGASAGGAVSTVPEPSFFYLACGTVLVVARLRRCPSARKADRPAANLWKRNCDAIMKG